MRTAILATFAAMLILAGAAHAGTPSRSMVWAKVTAAYVTQAKAHGLAADCTRWNRVLTMRCQLERRGEVVGGLIPSWTPSPCLVKFIYLQQGSFSKRVEVDTCQARWWLTPLPAPWTR